MTTFGFFLWQWLQKAIITSIGFLIFIALIYIAANVFSEKEFPTSDSELQFYVIICGILGFAVSFSIAVSDCFAKTEMQKGFTLLLLSFAVGAAGGIVLDGFETGFNEMKQNAIAGGVANLFLILSYSFIRHAFSSNKSGKQSRK